MASEARPRPRQWARLSVLFSPRAWRDASVLVSASDWSPGHSNGLWLARTPVLLVTIKPWHTLRCHHPGPCHPRSPELIAILILHTLTCSHTITLPHFLAIDKTMFPFLYIYQPKLLDHVECHFYNPAMALVFVVFLDFYSFMMSPSIRPSLPPFLPPPGFRLSLTSAKTKMWKPEIEFRWIIIIQFIIKTWLSKLTFNFSRTMCKLFHSPTTALTTLSSGHTWSQTWVITINDLEIIIFWN